MTDHMQLKAYKIPVEGIKPIAVGFGACLATDRITVDGAKVGYCYREEPGISVASGWVFLAGDETQEYADDPDNWAYYDINDIANCDPSIAVIIGHPIGSEFERSASDELVPVMSGEA
jgi:hypothetical protein